MQLYATIVVNYTEKWVRLREERFDSNYVSADEHQNVQDDRVVTFQGLLPFYCAFT